MRERAPMTQTMKASEARGKWSQVLNAVYRKQARVLVEKSGIPVAAIVSTGDLERLRRLEAQEAETLERMQAAFADVPEEQLEQDVAAVIQRVRAEALAKRTARAKE